MGVWIETQVRCLPGRTFRVTPYVGVWIETETDIKTAGNYKVTPYVGVWIETRGGGGLHHLAESLLMWECGLKPC